jgi:transmembrane 9 superfamily protein 2/4
VFRPPQNASLLCTYVGVGVQLFGMLLITMIFALLGFLSPANRGGLMTAMVMMFVFMGLFAGYCSARLYKQFRGEEWKAMTLRTALLFPGERGWSVSSVRRPAMCSLAGRVQGGRPRV